MEFGETETANAFGAVLAHSQKINSKTFKKGKVLNFQDIEDMKKAGLVRIVVARPEPNELWEDEAATILAESAFATNIKIDKSLNGRCDLYASRSGLFSVDTDKVTRFNLANEAYCIATLPPNTPVEKNQRVASIKIIPFAVPTQLIEDAAAQAKEQGGLINVHPYKPLRVGLIQTVLPGIQSKTLNKTTIVINQHLSAVNCKLVAEQHCTHDSNDIAGAIDNMLTKDLDTLMIIGASSTIDQRDIIPIGIKNAGGQINHFGLPTDPGNLLILGHIGSRTIIVLPGCARSPKRNGLNLVLERLAAGLPCSVNDIAQMGVGGLLNACDKQSHAQAEHLQESVKNEQNVAAIILAAGRSQRMGARNKLLMNINGQPMVTHIVDAAIASMVKEVIVVTGHDNLAVEKALVGRQVKFVHNPSYKKGLSSSLIRGIEEISNSTNGVLVCQGDMPLLRSHHLDRLIAAFNPSQKASICIPTFQNKRGNPVLWGEKFLAKLLETKGDIGARDLIKEHKTSATEVIMNDAAVLSDIDTPTSQVLEQMQSDKNGMEV